MQFLLLLVVEDVGEELYTPMVKKQVCLEVTLHSDH